ncbi:MAG: signal peptidase I [Acidimicrobiales bacterium]
MRTAVGQSVPGPADGAGGEGDAGENPGEPGERPGPARRAGERRPGRWLAEWAVIVVLAVVVAFLVRTFVAQTFYIPSTSMYPTLKAGDRIVVDKLSYDFHSVHRGDIVVFRRPPAENCGGAPVPDLVKRVIGLPGNVVSARAGHMYVNGRELQEPWLPKTVHMFTPTAATYTSTFGPTTVPPGRYFMMGDDRRISCDSRMWGTVSRSYFVGKVDLIVWPPSDLRSFF